MEDWSTEELASKKERTLENPEIVDEGHILPLGLRKRAQEVSFLPVGPRSRPWARAWLSLTEWQRSCYGTPSVD